MTNHRDAKVHTGAHPIATGMMPDDSKYYVANFLDSTISVINTATGVKIKDISMLTDYVPTGGLTGLLREATHYLHSLRQTLMEFRQS